VLVAASGLAREVLEVERALGRYTDFVVVDDDEQLAGTWMLDAPVVGPVERIEDFGEADLVVCAGRGTARRSLVNRLSRLGVGPARYARVLHPSVEIPASCSVGHGSILLASVVLTSEVLVGAHVVAMPHVTLTHDVVVEDFATLCAGVTLGGHTSIGQAAYLGMNAGVREQVLVGREATIGMGAVVLESVPVGETWVGVPAAPTPARSRRVS